MTIVEIVLQFTATIMGVFSAFALHRYLDKRDREADER